MKKITIDKSKSGPKGNAFWREGDGCSDISVPDADFEEAHELISMWETFQLEWLHSESHPFKAGDRVIEFNFEGEIPKVVISEVADIGPSDIRTQKGDLDDFIAVRTPKDFKDSVDLSLEQVLHLKAKGLITNFLDLEKRERLSPEEWDEFIKLLNLREPSTKSEEQTNVK
jgi:hypothetical protein